MTRRSWRPALAGLAVTLLIAGGLGATAEAHILRENNGIEAELHIPPADMPVAKQATRLQFWFGSEQGNFSLQHCDCQVTTQLNGHNVQTVALHAVPKTAATTAETTVNFPQAGAYSIVLTGKASDGSFDSFRMTYPARVAKPLTKPASMSSGILIIVATGILVVAMIGFTIYSQRKRQGK